MGSRITDVLVPAAGGWHCKAVHHDTGSSGTIQSPGHRWASLHLQCSLDQAYLHIKAFLDRTCDRLHPSWTLGRPRCSSDSDCCCCGSSWHSLRAAGSILLKQSLENCSEDPNVTQAYLHVQVSASMLLLLPLLGAFIGMGRQARA